MSNRNDQEEVLALLAEIEYRKKYCALEYAFQDEGKYARKNYPQSLRLFAAGKHYKERGYIAPNRVGKSYSMTYETALHLTGRYPSWWEGHKFTKPITAWVCGKTNEVTRDILQLGLLGPRHNEGSGLIPKDDFAQEPTSRSGIPGARQDAFIKHYTNGVYDGISTVTLKSYEQGIDSFMGTARDWIWLDEEPPAPIYTECLTRTATTGGHVVCTFTPLNGASEVFKMFAPGLKIPEDGKVTPFRFSMGNSWQNAIPHLSKEDKDRLMASYAPWELSARTEGVPTLGAGAVFPVAESEITCAPFEVPVYWPKFAGLDVGWKKTACVWCAYDKDNDTIYICGEYYRGYAEPSIHADAIKARGAWVPIAIDPASNTPNQKDGDRLFEEYRKYGLNIYKADNSVTAGVLDMLQRFSTGRLKIFSTCQNLLTEYRCYQYDNEGRIRKQDDHALDAARYAMRTGFHIMMVEPEPEESGYTQTDLFSNRDDVTGY
jgi:phage terminase large subunit-like protein